MSIVFSSSMNGVKSPANLTVLVSAVFFAALAFGAKGFVAATRTGFALAALMTGFAATGLAGTTFFGAAGLATAAIFAAGAALTLATGAFAGFAAARTFTAGFGAFAGFAFTTFALAAFGASGGLALETAGAGSALGAGAATTDFGSTAASAISEMGFADSVFGAGGTGLGTSTGAFAAAAS
ncbi:hypothetical protein [Novosphingobium sp. ST904]|uniref:hypothetical protein n=1 Tax=Novosphingobium sp. ST904 TaxID=1684385 RepID=UPI001E466472|nr:hypothetical protein [Novosphingobium sp. ST904]